MAWQHEEDLIQIGDTYYRFEREGDTWTLFKWGGESVRYVVTHHSCECQSFKFRKEGKNCKHVDALWELFPPVDKGDVPGLPF